MDEWLVGEGDGECVRFDASAPFPEQFMRAARITTRVNKPQIDDPSVLEEAVEERGLF